MLSLFLNTFQNKFRIKCKIVIVTVHRMRLECVTKQKLFRIELDGCVESIRRVSDDLALTLLQLFVVEYFTGLMFSLRVCDTSRDLSSVMDSRCNTTHLHLLVSTYNGHNTHFTPVKSGSFIFN